MIGFLDFWLWEDSEYDFFKGVRVFGWGRFINSSD